MTGLTNYQNWNGFTDIRFGYGSMLDGFLSSVPTNVKIDERSTVDVYMGVPFAKKVWLEDAHRVCFTMWETDKLPGSFIRWVGQYDQILVPCEHNVEVFSKHHKDVKAVPLGVDTKFWSPSPEPSEPFKFIAGGSLWGRKGLDLVVKAFNRLKFSDAVLEIKAAPHASDVPKPNQGPNIRLLRNWMSKDDQRDWFRSAHVYVAPARGEGFGLMPLQAIATGIPTILTATSGQEQFAHLATAVVRHRKVAAPEGGRWDEANLDDLTEAMWNHHEQWSKYRQIALGNMKNVGQFSWKKASEKLVSVLPAGRLAGGTELVYPNVQIQVKFRRDVKADIGDRRYVFKAGEIATIPEGVHQVLYDAGAIA